jgi:hypothetical protein
MHFVHPSVYRLIILGGVLMKSRKR